MNITLAQLSLIAAKLYFALHTYPPGDATTPPIAQASLLSLAAHTNLCQRSCTYALRELIDRKLITRLPQKTSPSLPTPFRALIARSLDPLARRGTVTKTSE